MQVPPAGGCLAGDGGARQAVCRLLVSRHLAPQAPTAAPSFQPIPCTPTCLAGA